jgi:hypothetical protein
MGLKFGLLIQVSIDDEQALFRVSFLFFVNGQKW